MHAEFKPAAHPRKRVRRALRSVRHFERDLVASAARSRRSPRLRRQRSPGVWPRPVRHHSDPAD